MRTSCLGTTISGTRWTTSSPASGTRSAGTARWATSRGSRRRNRAGTTSATNVGGMDHLLKVAERAAIPPFHVMDVLSAANARQRAKGDMISLAAGQPSAGAPKPVREAAAQALHDNNLG